MTGGRVKLEKWREAFEKYTSVTGEFYRRYRREYLLSSILTLFASLLLFPIPLLTRKLIDLVYKSGPPQEIIKLLVVAIVILLTAKILSYFSNLMFFKLNSKIILLLRKKMTAKILKSKLDLFKKYDTGYLLAGLMKTRVI